ncbi:MAG: hypothetical protein LIR50_05785 [Bacillota bacterium]|nr:hypothetical protein [Bacillota bacterium]
MIQVKEFLNYQEGQESKINEWLKETEGKIDILDIKYSVGTFQENISVGNAEAYSGCLIVYRQSEGRKTRGDIRNDK